MLENGDVQITVVTVSYNSLNFIKLMHESLTALVDHGFLMLICDNGSGEDEKKGLRQYFSNKEGVELIFRDQGKERASYAHARAMDLLLSRVRTKYALVMDSDCALLLKSWDTMMIESMQSFAIIGTSSPIEHASGRIGSGTFPQPFAMFMNINTYRSLGVSFLPGDGSQRDTAWQLKEAYERQGLPFQIFDSYNTRTFKSGPFACLEGVGEYYYHGRLIASHFGRGSTRGLAKYFREAPKNPFFNIFRYLKGFYEMRLWMNICRRIVAEQRKYQGGK